MPFPIHHFSFGYVLMILLAGCAPRPEPGAVAAATPEAAQAGREILREGGNAVDAAIAVALSLAVTEPAGSGLGGQTSLIIHGPGRPPVVLNGTSFAPAGVPDNVSSEDITGRRRTTIPTTVKVLDFARRHFGSGGVPWRRLVQPALRSARQGFVLGRFRQASFVKYTDRLAGDTATAEMFLRSGRPPRQGAIFRNLRLAETLSRLAEHGADDFYHGEIARSIDHDMRQQGGWLRAEDLAWLPDPAVLEPLHTTYRGWDVYTLPPPAGGWVVLQMLNLLELEPAGEEMDWLRLAESLHIGFSSRRNSPLPDLVRYQDDVARRISKDEAQRLAAESRGETTHFSVVDGRGMAVGVTQSLNSYFGAGVAHPELGMLYNDYMQEFELENPGHPYALRPGALPYSSMSATILARNGEPRLVLGGPGSSRIISSVVQVITRWVDLGQDIRSAVAAPRLHVVPERRLYLESESVPGREEFEARGWEIRDPHTGLGAGGLDPYFGGVHAVAWEDGRWVGAADPRRDGEVP